MDLTKDQILQFDQINKKIKELYKQQETLAQKILKGKAEKKGWIKTDNEDAPFLVVELTDNTKCFSDTTIISRVAYFKKFEVQVKNLKRKPVKKE